MAMPWDDLAEQFVQRPFVELPVHRHLATVLVDAITTRAPLLTIMGASGVGKSTAVWWTVQALQRLNPQWTWLRLNADEEMTPGRCCADLEELTHLPQGGRYGGTLKERFAHIQTYRQLTCLIIDEADLLPQATLGWLSGLPAEQGVMVGLVSTHALTTYPHYGKVPLPHTTIVYPPVTVTDLAWRIFPQLGRTGWFIGQHDPQYWPLSRRLDRLSGGSLRRLYHLLFYARWVAYREGNAPLRADHLQEAITAWETRRWRGA